MHFIRNRPLWSASFHTNTIPNSNTIANGNTAARTYAFPYLRPEYETQRELLLS